MDVIWNEIIKQSDNIRFRQADYFSPYCEAIEGCINEEKDGTKIVSINSFYRYDEIFMPLLEAQINEEEKVFLFDIIMHLATRQELKKGITKKEFSVRMVWDRIENGKYGKRAKSLFDSLDNKYKYIISHGVVVQDEIGESVTLFSKLLIKLLGDGVIYRNKIDKKQVLLYMAKSPSTTEQTLIDMACEFFLPIDFDLRIFEKSSFGIIEFEESMNIDEIVIF